MKDQTRRSASFGLCIMVFGRDVPTRSAALVHIGFSAAGPHSQRLVLEHDARCDNNTSGNGLPDCYPAA